jgi:hypothetical protein
VSKVGLVALALLLIGGCDPKREEREQQSASSVAFAEERLRALPNADKAQALGLLSGACYGAEPCDVQRRCRDAYAGHVQATTLTAAAKQKLLDGDAQGAAGLVTAAEQKLTQAARDVADCTDRASALRRHYKL